MPHPIPSDKWGLWDIEGISVRYISDTWVQFSCEHKVVNGDREIKNVTYTLFDRIRGLDFDSKVEAELRKFVTMLKERNAKIKRLREKTEKVKSTVHNLL